MKKYLFATILLSSACTKPLDPTKSASVVPPETPSTTDATTPSTKFAKSTPLPERLDCLRENNAALVIAHRGGPNRTHPENALESFNRSANAGALGMEIDIAESRDGVLFLMHDDDLERTTTGEGSTTDHNWAQIQQLNLETYSKTTDFKPPTLDEALTWAVNNDILLELDKKRSTSMDRIVEAVEKNSAENHVLIITYSDSQAAEVHGLNPNLTITATVQSARHLDRLENKGVNLDYLVAWTGTENPDPRLWAEILNENVEVAFGTLGQRGRRLDDIYWQDRNGSEYQDLVMNGATLIVTDMSDRVSRELSATQETAKSCGF